MSRPTTAESLSIFSGALPESLAREDFARLAVLLRYAADGCFAFAVYNYAAVREQVVGALRALAQPLPVHEWTWSPHTPSPDSYLSRLTEAQRHSRAIVFFYDLEKGGEAAWRALDLSRERLAAQPHALVFWITPTARGAALRQAPNFWSQRSGVFDFTVAQPDYVQQAREAAYQAMPRQGISSEEWDEKQRQLRLYQGLLAEYEADAATPKQTLFDLHTHVSQLLYHTDRYAEAKYHALAALDLARDLEQPAAEANTQKALGDLGLREADLKGARARYEAALPIYQAIGARLGEANALRGFGYACMQANDPAGAVEFYRQAAEIHRAINDRYNLVLDLLLLASPTRNTAPWQEVAQTLQEAALLADETDIAALREAALAIFIEASAHWGNWTALSTLLDTLRARHPTDTSLLAAQAEVFKSQRRYAEAVAAWERAVALDPNDAELWNDLAGALQKAGRLEEAAQAYSRAIERSPAAAFLYRNRADAFIELNRLDEAERDIAEAIQLEPEHDYTHGRQGYLELARGDFARARAHFDAARTRADRVEWQTGQVLSLLGLSEVVAAREGFAAAVLRMDEDTRQDTRRWLERIIRLRPDLAEAARELGEALTTPWDA